MDLDFFPVFSPLFIKLLTKYWAIRATGIKLIDLNLSHLNLDQWKSTQNAHMWPRLHTAATLNTFNAKNYAKYAFRARQHEDNSKISGKKRPSSFVQEALMKFLTHHVALHRNITCSLTWNHVLREVSRGMWFLVGNISKVLTTWLRR